MKKIIILNLLVLLVISCNVQEKQASYNPEAIELNNQATELIQQSKNDSALMLLDKAIAMDETYYLPHINKLKIYLERNDVDKALLECEKSLDKKPDYVEGWTTAAMLYDLQGKETKALEYYKKGIDLYDKKISESDQKDDIKANRLRRAFVLVLSGQEKEGKEEMNKLQSEFPDLTMIDEFLKLNKKDLMDQLTHNLQVTRPE